MWDKIKEFLADRFTEASTGRALTIFFTFVGWKLAPEHINLIAEVAVTALVLFGVLPDKKKSPEEKAAEAKALQEAKEAEARKVLGLDQK